jgi:hypothetical protein
VALSERPREAWLCLDCMLSRETGQLMEPLKHSQPTPLSLMDNAADLTRDHDRHEGVREYSDTRCAGCGSTLPGFRYRYADWSIS